MSTIVLQLSKLSTIISGTSPSGDDRVRHCGQWYWLLLRGDVVGRVLPLSGLLHPRMGLLDRRRGHGHRVDGVPHRPLEQVLRLLSVLPSN